MRTHVGSIGAVSFLLLTSLLALLVGSEARAQEIFTTNYTAFTGIKYSYSYYLSGTNRIRHGLFTESYRNSKIWNQGTYIHGKRTGDWLNNTSDKTNEINYIIYTYADDRKLSGVQYTTNSLIVSLMRYDPSRPPVPNYNDLPAWQEGRTYFAGTIQIYQRTSLISEPLFPGSTNFYYKSQHRLEYFTNNVVRNERYWVNYVEPSPVLKKTGWQNEGVWKDYWATGYNRQFEEWSEGEKHGVRRTWHYSASGQGHMELEEYYRWDRQHGPYRGWTSNGLFSVSGQQFSVQSGGQSCGICMRYWYKPDGSLERIQTIDYGPCGPPYDVGGLNPPPPPPDPGPPDTPNKSIYGLVCNALTGARLAGVAVRAGETSTTTDSNGFYSVSVGDVEFVTAQFEKSNYRTTSSEIPLSGVQSKVHNVNMVSSAAEGAITDVTSQYGLIFIGGISVNNTFTAQADWGGEAPGRVIFVMNGASRSLAASSSGASTTYDVGFDLNTALNLRANKLEVYSENVTGIRSPTPFVLHPVVLPVPKWSTKLGPLSTTLDQGVVTYKLKAEYPEKPMAIEINPEALGTVAWAAWSLVPVVGGQSFGIPPSQVGVDVSINSKGKGGIGGSGKMAFKAAGGEIEVNLNGKGLIEYDLVGNAGFEWKGAEIGGGVKGTIKRKFGPVTVIPALAGAIDLPIVGRPITWFNNRAVIDAAVSLGGDLKFNLVNQNDEIVFKGTEGKISSGVELGLGGDLGSVKARVSGGGTVGLTYQLPAAPDYLKKAEAEVAAKLKLTVWSYETTLENSKSMTYPSAGGASMPQAMAAVAPGGFRLLDTSFVTAEPYAKFAGRGVGVRALRSPGVMSAEAPFVSNVFPFAEPSFASRGTNHAVVYVVYDSAKPVTQGNELWFSLSDGGPWHAPTALTSDTRNDYAPAIAFAADGKLVAVWERVRATDYSSGNIEDLPPQLEIAWSVYDPATTSWSAPAFLTDDAVMDFAPMLAESPAGEIALCWWKSPGGQLIGTAEQPLVLHTALWQGNGLGPVTTHPHAFSNAFDLAFAYDGERLRAAWIQDADGDFATVADQRLHVSTRESGTWSAPLALFPDEGSAAGPALIATGANAWELFWQQDTNLVRLTDWSTPAREVVRADSAGLGFANLLLQRDDAGRILIAWEDLLHETPDLYARVRDGGVWSEDLRLTQSEGREAAVAGGLCADATIRLFYTSDRTNGVTDLYYAEHALHRNLAADADATMLDPASPELGEPVSITATVRNTGKLAVTNLAAKFYLGDPANGGVEIGQSNVQPMPLAAGAAGTATLVDWTLPLDIETNNVFVAFDPANQIAESDEIDNLAVISPVWIDLAVSGLEAGDVDPAGNLILTASIENRGNAIARNVRTYATLDGRTLATNMIAVVLPGRSVELMWILASAEFTDTQTVIRVTADPNQVLPDIDRDNNAAEIAVNRVTGRDTSGDGISDDWKREYFGHINVVAEDDDDGDGVSNYHEYLAGTDPLNADSVFAVAAAPVSGSTDWQVSWPVAPERRYQVFRSEDLNGDNWLPLQEEFMGWSTGTMIILDRTVPGGNQVFYHLRVKR